MSKHILLIDAGGFAHRAFHAGAKSFRSDGLPTGATIGFMGMLWSLLGRAQADSPTHGAAVFDTGAKTFRHDKYPDYKGQRDPAKRKELNAQFPFMRHASHAMGFETVEVDGFEADDVIATLAKMASDLGFRTTIVSQDKDFLQCVRDGWVEIIDPVARKRLLEADVKTKFGVTPKLVPDVQGLLGDSADNIPGVDGIGAKIAGRLIAQFGSLDALLVAVNQSGRIIETPAIRKALRKQGDTARLSRDLAILNTAVPLDVEVDALTLQPVERGHLKEMLRVLEADHKFDIMFTTDLEMTVKVPHTDAPLLWWSKMQGTEPKWPYPAEPQDGFYKRRLVRKGPWVAARVWREPELDFLSNKPTGLDIVHCEVAGRQRNPRQQWDGLARWPISKADFDYLVKTSEWARQYAPNSSDANPEKKIDWLKEELE